MHSYLERELLHDRSERRAQAHAFTALARMRSPGLAATGPVDLQRVEGPVIAAAAARTRGPVCVRLCVGVWVGV